ncbi:hypothetical protein KNP414_06316 [Paenibacillus mucilaginosus KNP414]|uniref:Uncharacterized protein n=1 Tax=Paenibacillus mucilaginosus (strain KNP414) TaxID=1036673 RepID=F8FLS1_PAEMK|nr:hypothetical protein KNP414_06316 [Paenibacillus mucilaginosus KNP414]
MINQLQMGKKIGERGLFTPDDILGINVVSSVPNPCSNSFNIKTVITKTNIVHDDFKPIFFCLSHLADHIAACKGRLYRKITFIFNTIPR